MTSTYNAFSKKENTKNKFYKRKKFWFLLALFILFLGVAGFFYKTGYILNKISSGNTTVLGSLWGVLPGGKKVDEENGQTNILLIGMRGQNIPGGGLLSDTIMVISLRQKDNKLAMISIPRDLYVKVPHADYHTKINAVYAHGEEGGKKQGMEEMKEIVGEVTGLKIHYVVAINFTGFKRLVDAVGGVEVMLETPFYETSQFVEGNECGGEFTLPAGKNVLDGERALCYVRSRKNTSDFDRAKRQQIVLKALEDKLISMGTLTDFSKVNNILNAIGDNVRTDMSSREMKNIYKKYSSLANADIYQRVFENSKEGALMVPKDAPDNVGYILIPRAGYDNYSEIRRICKDIFNLPPQSDIQPVKQYARPASKEKKKPKKKKKNSETKKKAPTNKIDQPKK